MVTALFPLYYYVSLETEQRKEAETQVSGGALHPPMFRPLLPWGGCLSG